MGSKANKQALLSEYLLVLLATVLSAGLLLGCARTAATQSEKSTLAASQTTPSKNEPTANTSIAVTGNKPLSGISPTVESSGKHDSNVTKTPSVSQIDDELDTLLDELDNANQNADALDDLDELTR